MCAIALCGIILAWSDSSHFPFSLSLLLFSLFLYPSLPLSFGESFFFFLHLSFHKLQEDAFLSDNLNLSAIFVCDCMRARLFSVMFHDLYCIWVCVQRWECVYVCMVMRIAITKEQIVFYSPSGMFVFYILLNCRRRPFHLANEFWRKQSPKSVKPLTVLSFQ